MAARLDNPNRVGTGFINFGAMQRQPQAAANWQTGTLLGSGGGAPAQVADIWNSTPAPMVMQPQQQQRLAPQPNSQLAMQPQLAPQLPPQPFGAPAPGPSSVANACALFNSLVIDPNQQARRDAGFPGVGGGVGASYVGLTDAVPGLAANPPPQPPTQSLMSLLQPTLPPQPPQLNPGFPMCNGGVPPAACASRAQSAFSNPVAAAPQCQLPSNGIHASPFASSTFAPPPSHPPPPRPAPSSAPRQLSSPADYAVAAANYKPPVAPRPAQSVSVNSVSRKPETSKTQSQQPARKEEWECPRCTFLNNSALRECEMCGFDRPGGESAEPAPRVEDDGWRTASSTIRKSVPVPSAAVSGKSKTQAKNEKRRAKKRGDGA